MARARAVDEVCLSAQPPADRSVQQQIPRRRWTTPAGRWAARPLLPAPRRLGNALEQTLRLASPLRPPRGKKEGTGFARAMRSSRPLTPSRGLCRSLALRSVPWLRHPASSSERGAATAPWASSKGGGVRVPRRAGLLGLRLPLCVLSSLLGLFRSVLRGGSVASRPSPPGGAAPQPGHQPPRSGGAAKGGSKDKTAEGQPLRRPSNPVARVFTPHQREEAQGTLAGPSRSHTPAGQAKARALCNPKNKSR